MKKKEYKNNFEKKTSRARRSIISILEFININNEIVI